MPLKGKHWHMHQDQDNANTCERVCGKAGPLHIYEHLNKVPQSLLKNYQQVKRIQEDKRDEILVISVSKTVVYEWAVVIEVFHAFVTYRAVE
jgi:hypothetical protein